MKPSSPAEFFGKMQALNSRTVDSDTKESLSKEIFIKTGKNGTVLLCKIPEKEAPEKFKKAYMASKKAQKARELAGRKIEDALTQSGVKITDNIRKALPGKNNMGDFNSLQRVFAEALLKLNSASKLEKTKQMAPVSEEQVLSAIKKELGAMNWSDPNCIGTLFRGTTEGQKLMTACLGETFTQSIEKCVADAVQSALNTLDETGSQDEALVALHKGVLQGLKNVPVTPFFVKLVFKLVDLVNKVAGEKLNDKTIAHDPAVVATIAKEIKAKVFAMIFLRTLSVDLAQSLQKFDNELRDAVEEKTGKPPVEGFKPAKVAAVMQSLFSNATDIDKKVGEGTGVKDNLPQYYQFVHNKNESNLSSFDAMNSVKRDVGLT